MEGEVTRSGNFLEFKGDICDQTAEQLLKEMECALREGAQNLTLLICSGGGIGKVGFRLYWGIKELLHLYICNGKPIPLWTYGVGDVASAAVVLFSAGDRRCLSKNARLRFHDSVLAFRPTVGGVPAYEIRKAIAQIREDGCFCKNETVALLLREFAACELAGERPNMIVVCECKRILEIIEQGVHSCADTAGVVGLLEMITHATTENSKTYAAIIAERSGLPSRAIHLFMEQERNVDSPLAVEIGLADEEV